MSLNKLEREVLEVIYKEHRQTHRGAREDIVFIAMGAVSCKDKSRIIFAMQALNERDLIAARPDAWAPTKEGVNFIEQPGWIGFDMAKPGADETVSFEVNSKKASPGLPTKTFTKDEICKIFDVPAHLIDEVQDRSFSEIEINEAKQGLAKESANEMMRFLLGTDRISDDLLNRCAAMTATLLAQAEQAYAGGDLEAWRDLHWLIETGKQLVALRGGL
ncbi:hypothetical protein [Vreelandella boliviensis]|uniref:hypothetical protein n=1 Tax=Vreelandella boliviensis TaxID=223527 RepID=UPI001B8D5D63|nr:hypothetical protein [Halomonas boliviensis]MBS3670177.1 hypothetical protein [Halomonas boliviensis]